MVSDSELLALLGSHIGIYPFIDSNVEGASVFLTSSQFAWSKETKKSIEKDNIITIPPRDTGIILTTEAISLDSLVSGICISRVSQTVKGLILPSTPIKPGWIGRLIIAVYNTNDESISIAVGERIAVVMFSKLKKEGISKDNRTSRADLLSYVGIQEQTEELKNALNDRKYIDPKYLIDAMEESEDYLRFKKRKKKKKDLVVIFFIICLIISVTLTVWYFILKNKGTNSDYSIALITIFLTAATNLAFKKWFD